MVAINALLPLIGGTVGSAVVDAAKEGVMDTVTGKVKEGAERVTGAVVDPAIDMVAGGVENIFAQNSAPEPTPNPKLESLLQNNDLTPFPNIQRALQEPDGRGLLNRLFQNPEPMESTLPPPDLNAQVNGWRNEPLTPIDESEWDDGNIG